MPIKSSNAHGFAYQPGLDGVRALAVAAVLLFHGGVGLLPGGFLGVDAFFVLSGFLITSLLLAERARHGRVRLAAFWGRRARRLLPALLVLLVVVTAVGRSVLPPAELALLRTDAWAALAYVANWRMINRGTDYFAQTAAPSPLQHTWSLGIEEQFYLLWPLLLVAVVAAVPVRRRRAALLGACLAGAAASVVCAAVRFDPTAVNRAYFGTDTRAQALLVGCALAAWLSWPRTDGAGARRRPSPGRTAPAVAGAAGVAVLAWLLTHADGAAPWLYRGGLSLAAVAVAAVLAHVVLSPTAAIPRALAVAPLVWLGRISYGVYLWHWPLFGFVTADRTGLGGLPLLALRCGLTVLIAATSYVLIEHPVRTGRARAEEVTDRPHGRRPAAARVVVGMATVVAAMGVTGAAVTVATAPLPRQVPAAVFALPATGSPDAAPTSADAGPVAPVYRPGRRPGAAPRITFLGDSVSWSLGTYLPPHPGLDVTVRAVQGCGIARLPDVRQLGSAHTNYPACPTWDRRWRRGVLADDPDVAVVLLDRWELMDRRLDGAYQHVGQSGYDAYLTRELDLAISVAGTRGAHVVLLTAPYTHRAERPDGGLYDEDQPARVDAWNRLLYAAAGRRPDTVTVIDLNHRVCPQGRFTWSVGDVPLRSDGLHFTPEGVQRWIAPWLLPKLAAIAVGQGP
jgi:peptidoglycan/LPS O-acetylase OafA/YrhL